MVVTKSADGKRRTRSRATAPPTAVDNIEQPAASTSGTQTAAAIHHIEPPVSPSTEGNTDSVQQQRPIETTTTDDASTLQGKSYKGTSGISRTDRNIAARLQQIEAEKEILELKLKLAETEKRKADMLLGMIEEPGSDYDSDYMEVPSKEDFVNSWIEQQKEAKQQQTGKEDNQARPTHQALATEPTKAPTVQQIADQEIEKPKQEARESKINSEQKPGDSLYQLVSQFTSAIASLADQKRSEQCTTGLASKVIMDLPAFNGAHTEWLSFKAIYDTTYSYFNDVENTARLRRSLKGRALEAVNSELIGHTKPDEIMKELELLFGRPDAIARAETAKLRAMPRCSESPKDICHFASKIRSSVVTLQALKKTNYLDNPELALELSEKLPSVLRPQWYKRHSEQTEPTPSVLLFNQFITEQARYYSAFAPPETTTEPNRHPTVQRANTATENRQKARCKICNREGHFASDCNKFKEANSDRKWELAKQHQMCFRCLRHRSQGHSCKPRKCNIDGCNKTHHSLLHHDRSKPTDEYSDKKEVVANARSQNDSYSYLKILPVRVSGPAGEIDTYALLDDGATVSLIDEELTYRVGAEDKGQPDTLHISTLNNMIVDTPMSRRIEVTVTGPANKTVKFRARTVPRLHLATQTVGEKDIAGCKHLRSLKNKLTYREAAPKILIGQDNWNLLLAQQVRRGPRHQPIASKTLLGWVLHGANSRILGHRVHFVYRAATEDENMDQQLKEYFALESLTVNPRRPQSDPEEKAEKILQQNTMQLQDGHIQTALLWKKEDIEMPNNYENSLNRLISIEKKIDRDPQLKNRYIEQMESLIKKQYAEPAPKNTTPGRTWYLPHFDVRNPAKPEKLRIVHDAAAKTRGVSLNDFLLTGPDLLQSLPGVLMRYRRHSIAVAADIAEMFMQVKVKQEDRDALRYLWRGNRREGPPDEYRMKSIIFGAASSPCTAIFAKNWNAEKHRQEHPQAVDAINSNHYMDDYLDSFPTVDEAIQTSKIVQQIHSQAHFELRKWVSNSTVVIEALDPQQKETATVSLGTNSYSEKILGLIWKPTTDELGFNLKLSRLPPGLLDKENPSKREALKIVMSLYDPLGFASPVTIKAKQILQETWRRGIDWDQQLDEDLARQWTTWITHLKNLENVTLPRCYPGFTDATSLQLHVFVDASESAYAAAAYWRAETPDGRVHLALVMARAKVAPTKVTSIPRLELQAAVLGSRIASVIEDEHQLKFTTKYFWTDSKTVITWIKNGSKSYKPFVAHRIAAIEENSRTSEWHWIPTKLNIADAATRDVPNNLTKEHEWYRGPSFLIEDPSTWPSEHSVSTELTGEEKVFANRRTTVIQLTEAIPDPNRFSKWERLQRATGRVLQFIDLCKRKNRVFYKRTRQNPEKDPDWRKQKRRCKTTSSTVKINRIEKSYRTLQAVYLQRAEQILLQASQQESFNSEIDNLRRNKQIEKSSRLYRLKLELQEDRLVLKSRIDAAIDIQQQMKSPLIVDGDHRIVQLYIDWTHRNLQHSGTEAIVNEVRQYYWVIRLRPVTKVIVNQCLQCRIRRAKPSTPSTGNHPKTRLAHHRRPFTYSGLDYFGPLTVTVGRQRHKRYVALFTCLTTRAVHLEIASSLSADSAIMALRRFIARRGCPTEIYSDNGTNMHGADKELREALIEETNRRGITWRFITPSAPFMGGAWERLVRSVKTALNATLQERHPHEEVLATLLCEAEYTVNSRPLTHVSVDSTDEESLTPNHFLLGGSGRVPIPGTFDERDIDNRKHWRRAQILADMFWQRWLREYLPELQHRREPTAKGPTLRVNDPVLIVDPQFPRNTWPRGRIVAVYPGPDGEVRTVEVQTSGGVLKRPTKRIVLLPC